VANRAENSVSVLSIEGKTVKVIDTVALSAPGAPSEQVSSVAITPDGKRALVSKFASHKVALLDIDGQKVSYGKYDMAVGLWPYNVQITSDGKLGLAGNNGAAGASDGQVDTVALIDLEASPPRVVDQVVVGDGPEGLAVSPKGGYAVAVILNGTGNVRARRSSRRIARTFRCSRSRGRRCGRSPRPRWEGSPRVWPSARTASTCTWETSWTAT
jgi:DNA-binding beta-propeller fold protein YncE